MIKMKTLPKALFGLSFIFLLSFCKKEDPIPPITYGNIKIQFNHTVSENEIIQDSLLYTNAAGNQYLINELQYFISDISLINSNREKFNLETDENIHYIDIDIPSSLSWKINDEFPEGKFPLRHEHRDHKEKD